MINNINGFGSNPNPHSAVEQEHELGQCFPLGISSLYAMAGARTAYNLWEENVKGGQENALNSPLVCH